MGDSRATAALNRLSGSRSVAWPAVLEQQSVPAAPEVMETQSYQRHLPVTQHAMHNDQNKFRMQDRLTTEWLRFLLGGAQAATGIAFQFDQNQGVSVDIA